MKLAHLIITHDFTEQLERLISRLQTESADIYIQLDKKNNIANVGFARAMRNVFFIKSRVKIYKGTYSVVQATLNGMEEILSKGIEYSHINLISAQDYPLEKAEQIESFLFANSHKSFMKSSGFSSQCAEAMAGKYNISDFGFTGSVILQRLLSMLSVRRKVPAGLKIYRGSFWLTITPECAWYVIRYLKNRPAVQRYFRLSVAPHQYIFQTILLNSPLSTKLVNNNLRYTSYSMALNNTKILADAIAMISSEKLFARKFDTNTDSEILDYLDDIAGNLHDVSVPLQVHRY